MATRRVRPFHSKDQDGAVVTRDEVKIVKEDTVSSRLMYRGRAHALDAADTESVWQIERIFTEGNIKTSEFAVDVEGNPSYTFKWSDRNSTSVFDPVSYEGGTLLRCDGSNDYVTLGNQALLDFDGQTEAFSISAWFQSCSEAEQVIFSKQGAANAEGYRLALSAGKLFMHIAGGADRIEVSSSFQKLNDEKLNHVVVTHDGGGAASGISMVINGVADTALSTVVDTLASTSENSTAAQISGRNTTTEVFDGYLDEIAVWDVELSTAEAQEIYNSGARADLNDHSQALNLVGWWNFESESWPTISDKSDVGSNLDGTATNFNGPHDLVLASASIPSLGRIATADSLTTNECQDVTGTTVGTKRTLDVAVKETVGSTFTPAGLRTAIKVTTMDVTSAAALALPATALTDRNSLVVHNATTGAEILYVGPSNVTADNVVGTTSGHEVGPGETFAVDIQDNIILYGRAASGETVRVKITEVA
jgi:hypothetical protein